MGYTGDPEKDYVNVDSWQEQLSEERKANPGITDTEIRNKYNNSSWDKEGSKYKEWANSIIAEPTEEEAEPSAEQLREEYSNDNAGYKKAAKDNAIKLAEGKMGSIWDAYNNGQIDKQERNYLIFDAISKAMSKSGDTLAAIAAAYTGGSANFGNDTPSLWEQRMTGVNEAATSAAQRSVEGSSQEMEKETQQANLDAMKEDLHKVKLQLQPAEYYSNIANNKDLPPYMRNVAMLLSASSAGNDQDMSDYAMGVTAGLGDEIQRRKTNALKENPPRELSDFEAAQEVIREVTQLFGEVGGGAVAGTINGLVNSVKEGVNDLVGGTHVAADGFVKGRNESDSINKTWAEWKKGTPYAKFNNLGEAKKQAKRDGWYTKGTDIEFLQMLHDRYAVPENKASFDYAPMVN